MARVKLLLALAAIVLLGSGAKAGANYWWPQKHIAVSPPHGATPTDNVSLTLSGLWGDSCVPDRISHTRVGETIQIDVEHPGINVACLTVISDWSLTAELGNLPPGEYSMVGTLYAYDPFDPHKPRHREEGPDVLISGYRVSDHHPADMNHDHHVDGADLAMLVSHYGMSGGATPHHGDLNRDGLVSLADVVMLTRSFSNHTTTAHAAVPEPSAAVITGLLLGGFGLAARRKFARRHVKRAIAPTGRSG